MRRWIRTSGQGRMPNDRFRIGVTMVGIEIDRTFFHEIAKTAFAHPVTNTPRQVTPKLVNRDLQNEFRRLAGRRRFRILGSRRSNDK